MTRYTILTDELADEIAALDEPGQANWLFLDPSEEFRGYWQVDSLSPHYFFDFEDIIGHYRLVSPIGVDEFLGRAVDKRYQVAFTTDPVDILATYERLQDPPPFSLNSTLDNTVNGFLPWQVVGFNKLVRDESITAGIPVWDTGAGKTAFMASAIRWHQEFGHPFDLALVVCRAHNKTDTKRKLLRLADIESTVIEGLPAKRYNIYGDITTRLIEGESVVAITNYEKFREDDEFFKFFLSKRNVLFFWDEMPKLLSNADTQVYKAVKKSIYASPYTRTRPAWMRHWELTATPIQNTPMDQHSCIRLMDPALLGSAAQFKSEYVASSNFMSGKPQTWKNLDRMAAKIDFMVHRVSKSDPEVAAMFPEVIADTKVIDWHPKHRALYDRLTGKAKEMVENEFEDANILSLIQILQMLCDAPSMIKASADNREAFSALLSQYGDMDEASLPFGGPRGSEIAVQLLSGIDPKLLTDVGHTKLDTWREIMVEKHPEAKIITHSTWADYIFPVWTYWLDQWGITYVTYTGTDKQKQEALDSFRQDPNIRVFLSGDAGSDSLDIPQASVGVNYNGPWTWVTEKQREGRRDRVDSTFATIYTYNLFMADSIDERKAAIRERKHDYHVAVFEDLAAQSAVSATMTKEDLKFMLLGDIT